MNKKNILILLSIVLTSNIIFAQSPEFKGVWVATVKRLDFPSRYGLNSYELKHELTEILDRIQSIGANAVVFQIRPAADAFYNSPYEPWSEWLTGKQGRAPYPYFDPLEFLIEESHKRNIEFHAWINPFRAAATYLSADIVDDHITKKYPEWFFNYGSNKYFDPGIPDVQDYLLKIITDIISRYNIDGIHFDDYFYPYPLRNDNNQIIEIPDKPTFWKYNRGFVNIEDWRRDNINMFVERVHDSIKKINHNIVFGISPCGVWRNKSNDPDGSNTRGLSAYDYIYADGLTWLKYNWIDYIAPQIYWHIGHNAADFETLVQWWDKHSFDVNLYIGINIYNVDPTMQDPNWGNPNQIPSQIKIALSYPSVKGFILYRYKTITKNPLGLNDSLRYKYFYDTTNTLLANSNPYVNDTINVSWLNKPPDLVYTPPREYPPHKPINLTKYKVGSDITFTWKNKSNSDSIKQYEVYKFKGSEIGELNDDNLFLITYDNFVIFNKNQNFKLFAKKYTFVIKAIGKNKLESKISDPIQVRIR